MIKVLFTICCVLSILAIVTMFIGVSSVEKKTTYTTTTPHMYNNTAESLSKIHITVFYFIPQDKSEVADWQKKVTLHLEDLKKFHTLTFHNKSHITYSIITKKVSGEKKSKDYESTYSYDEIDSVTKVKEELERRVLSPTGDLYQELTNDKTVKNVYLVIFEGKGAAAKDNFFLVSLPLLKEERNEIGSTFLAHEFYHTLGLPDNYTVLPRDYGNGNQSALSILSKRDIMGYVTTPISSTYIDSETLRQMNVFDK